MKTKNQLYILPVILLMIIGGCKKMDRPQLGSYPKDANPPGGPLKFYTAFDGTDVDSIRANFATDDPLTFVPGISGQAIQGAPGKFIKYPSANDFAQVTSFTVSFWMKKSPHKNGAEFVFSLPSTTQYWHNSELFMLIEDDNQSSTSLMATKLAIQDQWFEFVGPNRIPNMLNGSWHHMVYVYDEKTSKLTTYVDGVALTGLPSNLTDVKNGSSPRGALSFKDVSQFIVGGLSKHAGIGGSADSWMLTYSGQLDQLRLYGKALTAAEITALYNSKL
jgi:hypothetical protein